VSLLRWLGLADEADGSAPVDSLGEIEKALSHMDPSQARYLAAFAYILGRVARADHEITDKESVLIERFVAERGHLTPEQSALVVRIAKVEGLRHGGTEDFIVTREMARTATREQKLALLDCLFAVSSSDASILTVEDNEIRRVASELGLEHADYIRVRAAHSHNLEVLRDRRDTDERGSR
jgi:uncharacterized tellurite resistance protein B-like protein